jgi:hypothetical protein
MSYENHNLLVSFASKGIKRVQGELKSFGASFKSLGRIVSSFQTLFVGAVIFNLVKSLAQAAGAAETTNRRFQRTFKESAVEVQKSTEDIADSTNRAVTKIKSGLVAFNSFFKGLGFAGQESTRFSIGIQKASLDLASFYGIEDDNAQKRFLAALAGSPEVLDQFGINLKQAALQVELYNMGIKTSVQNTDELIKTQARLSIITRAMTANGIMGDAVRNIDSYGNQIKGLDSKLLGLSESIGTKVVPHLLLMANKIGVIAEKVEEIVGNAEEAKKVDLTEVGNFINEDLAYRKNKAKLFGEEFDEMKALSMLLIDLKFTQTESLTLNGKSVSISHLRLGVENRILAITQRQAIVEQQKADAQVKFIEGKGKRADDIEKELARTKELNALQKTSSDDLRDLADNYSRRISELTLGELISGEQINKVRKLKEDLTIITNLLAKRDRLYKPPTKKAGGIAGGSGRTPSGISNINPPDATKLFDFVSEFADVGFSDSMDTIGETMALAVGGVFADSIAAVLDGSASFSVAFKQALKAMSTQFAAEFAMRAIYHTIIGTAAAALGNVVKAGQNFGAAAAYGAGALALGGLSAALPSSRAGASGGRGGAFSRSSGQSSFNQQLVAQVSGDQLRFVLQESDRSRFRRNG